MSDLQLSAGVSQRREEVQLDPGLGAQVVLQVLSLLLHGRQGGEQHVRLFLHATVLSQSLSSTTQTSVIRTAAGYQNLRVLWFPERLFILFVFSLIVFALMDIKVDICAQGTNAPLK